MQTTSALYKTIIAGEHWFETRATLLDASGNGHELGEDAILSLDRDRPGMAANRPSIGGALASTLRLTILQPTGYTIPQRGQITVEYRARSASQTSEWLAAGTYYIDTRKRNRAYTTAMDTLEITAYDAMIKAEQDYPDTEHDWPYLDRSVVAEIASAIGVTVDSRTNGFLTRRYMVDLPLNYTMREVLEHIAGANGGNFIITADNKLLFVPLFGLDPEENLVGTYLSAEGGANALTFGTEGWYILV